MAREISNTMKVAAVEMAAAIGALAAAAGDYPIVAVALLALGVTFFIANRIRSKAGTAQPHEVPSSGDASAPLNVGERDEFVDVLQQRVEAAQHKGLPLTLAVVTPRVPLDTPPAVRDAAVDHIRGSIDRITRATDHWGPLGDGRFGVILENCIEEHATAYGDRLAVAIDNRPLLAEGHRVEVLAVTVPSLFDGNQFYGAADFLAAAEQRAIREPVPTHHLVADTRLLRQRFYGKDYGARAA